ncbi:MAG: hypothetical protein V9F00_05095 [Nocardioides sp.]
MGLLDRFGRGRQGAGTVTRGWGELEEDLYQFGLYEVRPLKAPDRARAVGPQIELKYYRQAIAGPTRFAQEVMTAARHRGGWVSYGGMRLLNSLLGPGEIQAVFDEVSDLAFAFLRSRNINFVYLSMREIDWWVAHHPGEDYLTRRAPRPPREGSVTPLAPGERRRLAHMGPDGNNNDIYVFAAPGAFQAIVVTPGASWADAVRRPWQSAPDLYGLYVEVAEAMRCEPPWCEQQLKAFIPLDLPNFTP